ncbi:MAG: S-layer homology domain-containing protein [Oscillospiraceae bacterium]
MLKKDNIADGEKNDYVNITYTVIDEKGGIVGTYVIEANKTTGTWTAGSAAAITSPDVGTYNYKVTCVVSDVNKENGAASVEASGTMTLSIAANTGLIVSGNNYTGKYDGASHGEAATANVDGATIEYSTDNGATWTDTVPTIKDVGEINVTVKASMANYSDATATYTLKVTPRTVTLTSETASKPYDGDPLTRPVVTIGGDGFVDGEVTDIKAIGSVTNVSDSPVTNTIVYTTTDEFVEDNYNITKDEGTLTITKSGELSVNAKGYDGKYDGQTHNGNVTATEGATLSYSTDGGNTWIATEPTIKNVGEINVTVKASMANYSDATATYTLKVTPRTVTLTSETASKTYDGTPLTRPVVTVTGDGFVDGEVTDIKATGSVTNVSEGSVTNTIVYTTTDKFVEDNYNITKAEGKLSITPLAVTVTAKDYTKYVGEKDPAFEATVTGTINNDTVSYTISREKGETAGTYSITPAGAEAQGNYTVTYNAGTLTINRRPYIPPVNPPITDKITVEITGNSDSVVYDGTEHSVKDYTVKISDSRYTEKDFTFSGKALASGVNAGAYEMGLKADQFKNTNARFTNVEFIIKADGVLTITQRPLTITAGSAEGIAPVTCDKYTVEGLATGDKVDSVKITGIQSEPGESPNVASDAVIKNAKGEDVTANYKITYVDGVLKAIEVLNKEIHFNYVIGYTDGTIRPNNDISRAEVATIFFRLLTDEARTQYDKTTSSFSDIKDGAWCCRAVSTLTNMGIIKGYTDGSFQPNKSITRAELATIIARFAKLDVNTKTFSDINGHWAQKSIELAAGNGWINGYTDGTFRPNKSIIRAETFAMINRVLDRQTESVSDLLPTSEMNMWSDNLNENAWYYKDVQEATNYHKCDRVGDSVYEKWTEKVPDIDWASYQI